MRRSPRPGGVLPRVPRALARIDPRGQDLPDAGQPGVVQGEEHPTLGRPAGQAVRRDPRELGCAGGGPHATAAGRDRPQRRGGQVRQCQAQREPGKDHGQARTHLGERNQHRDHRVESGHPPARASRVPIYLDVPVPSPPWRLGEALPRPPDPLPSLRSGVSPDPEPPPRPSRALREQTFSGSPSCDQQSSQEV